LSCHLAARFILIYHHFVADALDVTKQSDMSGFYRNLYKQTLGSEPDAKSATEDKNQVEIKVKQEKEADSPKKDTKR
jgi:hypothetical protein